MRRACALAIGHDSQRASQPVLQSAGHPLGAGQLYRLRQHGPGHGQELELRGGADSGSGVCSS